ncbi:DUF930 domain-containing protein [Pleomorphomonas oryzae]|uniref:DUF930 domain-containing protein n=1 Tax=Pleomorphomonas oryzae TaxID=261934 RepID=UPI00146C84F5|nr:DUF930 domain-containing protein [Pleomorphomonas oryzae]
MRIAQTLPRPATALSVVGHAVFLAVLAIETPRHMAIAQPPAAVEVVIVAPPKSPVVAPAAPSPIATPPPQAISPSPASPAQTVPPAQTASPSSNTRVTATQYFASAVLDNPRNRETRQTIATLGSDERLIQLCSIEAMEQLKHWKAGFVPHNVVAYAMSDPSLTSKSIEAPGAAVYADGKWYRLSFRCTATDALDRVASFDFTLGRPIPHREWEQHSLPELVEGDPTD